MLHTPKITPGGSTAISPVIWFAGITGATFDETLTNYTGPVHDLYTFTYGYDETLEKSHPNASAARIPRGNYYVPQSWNENNFILKHAGKTAFTPFSVTTGWFFQYGPEYEFGLESYSATSDVLITYQVRNIGPLYFSSGIAGIGPRWVLVAPDVVMSMEHFTGSASNRSPSTTINFIGSDGIKRGYTLEVSPHGNGTTANCIICQTSVYQNYDSDFSSSSNDLIFCKLSSEVHSSIKPIIFLNPYTKKEKFITESVLNKIPYLTINRCRTIGYLNSRFAASYYNQIQYINNNPIYYSNINETAKSDNFYKILTTFLTHTNSSQKQFLNKSFIQIDSESDLVTELNFDIFDYIKYCKIPDFYLTNLKYENTLVRTPIHNADSTTPQFILADNQNEYRPVLVSLYGSGGSAINLWGDMGNVIEDGVLPVLGSNYSSVERLKTSFINSDAVFYDKSIKKPFGVDSSVFFFPAPKSAETDDITICAIDDLPSPNLAKMKGLPPFYYSETDDLYKGFTNTAINPYYSNIPGMSDYGTISSAYTFDEYTLEMFNEIKSKLELKFNFSEQSDLFLQTDKKYIFAFSGNDTLYNRSDITQSGITHIKYDDYADWISLVILGVVPSGLSHAIRFDGIKNSLKTAPINYYLSSNSTSIDTQYLISNRLKKLKQSTEFPYFYGPFVNLTNINSYFNTNYNNFESQLQSITSSGYPLLRYNQPTPYTRNILPYPSGFNNNYRQITSTEETPERNHYIFDSSGLTGTIYLHAVKNNEITATMPIHFERNISNLLLSSRINILGSTAYYEISKFKETHMEYLGGTYPPGITVTGFTFEWNKEITDYIPSNKIQISGNNYSIYSDGQEKTEMPVVTTAITGSSIISFGITA